MSDEHNTPDNSAVSKPRRTRRPAAPKAADTGAAPEQAATKTSAEPASTPKATAEKAPATASTAKPSRARTPRKSAATAQASTAETGTSLANAAQTSAPAQKPAPDAQKSDARPARPARTPRPARATAPASKPAPAPKTADTATTPAAKETSKGTVATGMDAKKPRNTRTARKPAAAKDATGTSATDNSGGPASPASFTSPPATTAATPQISSTSETPPASVSPSAPADRSGLSRARSTDSVSPAAPAAPAANVEGEDRPARPRGRSRNTRSTARPTGTTDAAGTAGTGRTQAPPATAAVAGTTATGRTPAGAAAAAAVAGTGRTAPAQPAPEGTPFERRPHRDAPAHAAPRDSQAEGTADAGLATAATDSSASPASKVEGETLSAEGEAQPTRKNRRGRRGGRGRSRKSRQTGQGTELSADQEADQDAEGTASPLTARPHAKTTHISGDASHTDFDDSEDDDSQTRYMGDARDDVYDDDNDGDDGDDEAFIKANSETPARGRTAKKESTRRGAKVKEKEKEKDVELDSKPGRRKMFISVVPGEQVEVALVEEGVIGEYYLDMLNQAKTKGNIYKGVVHNVDANLQAAFVSYGAHKNGFLQIDEIHSEYYLAHHETAKGKKFPPIQKVIKPGQEVLVQVVKEPTGNKGAFLTTWLSLAGRFLVLTPGQEQIGVSRKVDNDEERARLREMMNGIEPGEGLGVIVRTVSAGTSKTTLKNDLQYLKRVWKEIRRRGTSEVSPSLVYQESSLAERAVRDYLTEDVCEVWVDNETVADSLRETVALLFPRKEDLVRVHVDVRQTLWERFNIQRQLEQIYSREVTLPSGGRLVFDQTEALMAIDINSGKISGKANFESMALKTNIEAAEAIARHLRLRDIGGQIVIDFIEMRDKSHVREVEKTLRNAMKNDRARHDVARMSSFGLLEIVRQRTGSSALAVTMEPCPCCQGTGIRRNMEWQSLQALRQIGRQARTPGTTRCVFESNAELGMYLLNHKRDRLREMEQQLNIPIEIRILA